MKKFAKVLVSVLVLVTVMASLTACGLDVKKIAGDWKLETMGGKSVEEYSAANGVDCRSQITFDDKKVTMTSAYSSASAEFQVRSNGVEATFEGLLIPFAYDEKADTITINVADPNGNVVANVYKRGTVDFSAAEAEAETEGEEEYYEEEE